MHNPLTLQHSLGVAAASSDWAQVVRLQNLIATTEHRYDFVNPPLNNMVEFAPVGFAVWLKEAWEEQ